MIKIIEKYFKFKNLALKEEFELQFDENNSDFAIKFENAVIQRLREIAEYKAKNKRTYKKRNQNNGDLDE